MNSTTKTRLNELLKFIQGKLDARELKRALAVKLALEEYSYRQIQSILNVSVGFISKWKKAFLSQGTEGLLLAHQGAKPLLNQQQKQTVIEWLKQKNSWDIKSLYSYILSNYQITFKSQKSYYKLFKEAGISWKKSQKKNPKKDPDQVQEKKEEIKEKLSDWKEKINNGNLRVFLVDECHLLWGDICGYVWGKTSERVEVPMTNEREKQTYYGALNYQTKEFFLKAYDKADSEKTVDGC